MFARNSFLSHPYPEIKMGFKGSKTVLYKECERLGLTFTELMTFIENNPYAMSRKVIKAFSVYKKEMYTNV